MCNINTETSAQTKSRQEGTGASKKRRRVAPSQANAPESPDVARGGPAFGKMQVNFSPYGSKSARIFLILNIFY